MNPEEVPDFYSLVKPNQSETPDFYSYVEENKRLQDFPDPTMIEVQEETIEKPKTLGQRTKEYFTSGKLGQAAALQMRSGGSYGAPSLEPKVAKKVATEVATIATVEALFAPVYGYAAASKYAPKVLTALTRLTQAGTTGAATATTSKLVEGELPTKEELIKNGLEWAAVDLIMQALHLTAAGGKTAYDFGKAVDSIAKKDKIPKTEVLSKLWNATKAKIKRKFGKEIKSPDDIKVNDVEILMEEAKAAEKEGLTKEVVDIEVPKKKYSEEVEKLNITDLQKNMYQIELDRIQAYKENKSVDKDGWPMPPLVDIYNEIAMAHYLPPKVREKYAKLAREEEAIIQAVKATPIKKDEIKTSNLDKIEPTPQTDFSSKTLKKQKEFILDAIDDAIDNPQKVETITIQVQSDGVLKINNNPETLDLMKRRVKKEWPEKLEEIKLPVKPAKPFGKSLQPAKPVKTKLVITPVQVKIKEESVETKGEESSQRKSRRAPSKEKVESRRGAKTTPISTTPKSPKIGKKQAAKRSDIIKLFRKAFNDPIRIGKIRGKALGIHRGYAKVTRLLRDNDIETAAHEIGHNLHYTLYGGEAQSPKELRNRTINALRPYLEELGQLAHYEPYTLEGFAEFTRLYVTNPEVAKKLAPRFFDKFEKDLESQFPDLKNALLEARDYYESYLEGTPESRIDAQIDYGDKGLLKGIIDFVKGITDIDNIKTNFLDDLYPAKKLVAEAFGIPASEVENLKDERNLYRALRILKGAIGKGDVFLKHETFDPITLEKTGESLRDILNELKNDQEYKEFNRFLVARRAIEKASQGIETGINPMDAEIVFRELNPKYGELSERLDKFTRELLNYIRKLGLISRKQQIEIARNNLAYAPFQRVMTPEKKGGVAGSGGKLQAKNPLKRMKGSTRDIIAPIESLVKNMYTMIVNAEKNRVGQILGELSQMQNIGKYVEQVPTPIKLKAKISQEEVIAQMEREIRKAGWLGELDLGSEQLKNLAVELSAIMPDIFTRFGAGTYPAGENIITVYYEGKPKYFEVSPELYEMWTKGTAPYSAGLIVKALRVPARILRAGAILNPRFIQKNIIRDTWGGMLFTRYGKSLKDPVGVFIDSIYSPLSMVAKAAKKGELYVEWMKAGGGMSTMQSLDRKAISDKIDKVKKDFRWYNIISILRHVAEITEEANRLSEFERALEVEAKTRVGKEIAAFASRDVSIDYAKIGLKTKMLNQIIPFYNATIQGTDKLVRTMANPEARNEFLVRGLAFVVLPALVFAWLNKDDEDIEELQEQEKDFNFTFKIGNKIFKLPVPFETGVILNGLTRRMFNYFMKEDPRAFEGYFGSIKDAIAPSAIPTMFLPLVETFANKNFFTGGRIIPAQQEKLTSQFQYKNYTSLTARLLGRAMNYMLGEDTRSKWASPAILDHFITSWTAGLGKLMIGVSEWSLDKAGLGSKIPKPERAITERLGLDAFSARFPRANTKSIEKFYDFYQDYMARTASLKYANKMELKDESDLEAAEKRIEKLYDRYTINRAYKAIQNCQREINNIMNDPSIGSHEKKMLVDELYMEMINFAREANKEIYAHRKEFKLENK